MARRSGYKRPWYWHHNRGPRERLEFERVQDMRPSELAEAYDVRECLVLRMCADLTWAERAERVDLDERVYRNVVHRAESLRWRGHLEDETPQGFKGRKRGVPLSEWESRLHREWLRYHSGLDRLEAMVRMGMEHLRAEDLEHVGATECLVLKMNDELTDEERAGRMALTVSDYRAIVEAARRCRQARKFCTPRGWQNPKTGFDNPGWRERMHLAWRKFHSQAAEVVA